MNEKILTQVSRGAIVIIGLILIWLLFAPKSYGQCERVTPYTADFTFQMNGKNLNSSLNFGFFNTQKLSIQAGARIYDTRAPNRVNEQKVVVTPTASILLKQRFNGEYSKVVHAIGLTGGPSYHEASYRLYGAPNGYSFATIGGIASYSNVQGMTIGFVIMAIF